MFLFLIAEDIEMYHDLWIVGNTFLKESINTLVSMRQAPKANKKITMPYIYKQFNVQFNAIL